MPKFGKSSPKCEVPTSTKVPTRSKFPAAVEKVMLYGSRAKGTYRLGSDIDLTLLGADLNLKILFRIETELDDLLLPYEIDLSIFDYSLTTQDL